jgi:hypothetical protein
MIRVRGEGGGRSFILMRYSSIRFGVFIRFFNGVKSNTKFHYAESVQPGQKWSSNLTVDGTSTNKVVKRKESAQSSVGKGKKSKVLCLLN